LLDCHGTDKEKGCWRGERRGNKKEAERRLNGRENGKAVKGKEGGKNAVEQGAQLTSKDRIERLFPGTFNHSHCSSVWVLLYHFILDVCTSLPLLL